MPPTEQNHLDEQPEVRVRSRRPMLEDFLLGPWTVHPARNRIVRGDLDARLGPKVMATLVCLAEHPGAVVSKEVLIERVWGGEFVSDEVVTSLIYALRRSLEDRARAPRFIETIRGRGYRLVAAVTPIVVPAAVVLSSSLRATAWPRRLPPRRRWTAVATAVITATVIAALGGAWLGGGIPGLGSAGLESADEGARSSLVGLGPAAAESYELGRHFLRRGTMNSFEKARRYFTETIIQAPSFAPAHVALAEAWLEAAPALPPAAQQAAFQQARRAAESALAVDADVPQAHSALGWISLQHTRNPSRAARFFERETEQHPDGDRHLGRYLSARGQHGDAMAVMARHVAAEPASKTARLALAEVFYRARQYTDALRELERVQDLDGDDVDVARLRMDVLSALGHHSEALQACQRDLELSGDRSPTSSDLGSAFARGGLLGARRLMFQQLVHSVAPPPDPVRLAQLSARIGEPGASLAWLDQADQERRGDLVWLDVDPAYDTLRSVPRFHSLLERLGLDPTPGS